MKQKHFHKFWHVTLASLMCLITGGVFATPNPYGLKWHCTGVKGKWACRVINMPGAVLYSPYTSTSDKKSALIKALGWVVNNDEQTNSCGGHYYFPKTPTQFTKMADARTKIVSGLPEYQVNGNLKLSHGVVIDQPGRHLYAESATIEPDPETKKLKQIHAAGNIRLRQPGMLVLGQHLKANLVSHHATLNNAYYLARVTSSLSGEPQFITGVQYQNNPIIPSDFTGFAHGKAENVQQVSKDRYVFNQATYSTCPPTKADWNLKASKITLNNKTHVGVARNVLLKFYDVPVFYAPYFSFSLNNQRKSGLLYPLVGFSTGYGYYFGQPIYLNLAPNYDDTVTPQYYTKRGFMLSNQFRWLLPDNNFKIDTQWMPKDLKTRRSRYGFFIRDQAQLPWGFHLSTNYNQVSDSNYLRDFSNQQFGTVSYSQSTAYSQTNAEISNTVIIPRTLTLSRQWLHWEFNTQVSSYKVLGSLSSQNKPYNVLPSVSLTGQYPNLLNPISFSINSNYTNFQKTGDVSGQRYYTIPKLSLSLQKSYGFVIPSLALNVVQYKLRQLSQLAPNVTDKNLTRVLPIFDVNSGLYFERQFHFLNKGYSQTLEPHIFYLYVPYRDQNSFPVFDTSINTLTFSQLFNSNKFSGEDRIENANQLSLAATTSIENNVGEQILSAGIGQVLYFQNRRVSLCSGLNCIDTEQPNHSSDVSPLLGQFAYQLNQDWSFTAQINYKVKHSFLEYQQYSAQYKPSEHNIFNLSYIDSRLDYGLLSTSQLLDGVPPPGVSQISGSFLWGLGAGWHIAGSVNYSLNSKKALSEFAGLEYDTCCWKASVLFDRYLSTSNPNEPNELNGPSTTGVMFEFELKGLGSESLGGSTGEVLALLNTIPGYSPSQSGFN